MPFLFQLKYRRKQNDHLKFGAFFVTLQKLQIILFTILSLFTMSPPNFLAQGWVTLFFWHTRNINRTAVTLTRHNKFQCGNSICFSMPCTHSTPRHQLLTKSIQSRAQDPRTITKYKILFLFCWTQKVESFGNEAPGKRRFLVNQLVNPVTEDLWRGGKGVAQCLPLSVLPQSSFDKIWTLFFTLP